MSYLNSYSAFFFRRHSHSPLSFLLAASISSQRYCRSLCGFEGCRTGGALPFPLALLLRSSTSLAYLITKMPFLSRMCSL